MEYKNVFVAVCDILGFKDLILNNESETIKELFNKFLFMLEVSVTGSIAIPDNLLNNFRPNPEVKDIKLNFNLFSDTVVLWTNDDSVMSYFYLLTNTAKLFRTSIKAGLPLRGAISQGDLIVSANQIDSKYYNVENIIYGSAIINAYQLEREQNWSGCVFDPDLVSSGNDTIRLIFNKELQGPNYLLYNVPIKPNGSKQLLTLNWVDWFEEVEMSEERLKLSFEAHNKSIDDKDVKTKIENTIAYYTHSLKIKKHFIDK